MCVIPPRFGLEVNGKLYAPSSLTPMEENSVAHCIGACMSPRNDLYILWQRTYFPVLEFVPLFLLLFGPLRALFVISTELSQRQRWIYFEKYVRNFILSIYVLRCIPCRLVETCQRVRGTCCLYFQSSVSVLKSFGKFLPDYTALQPIRQHPSSYRLLTSSF